MPVFADPIDLMFFALEEPQLASHPARMTLPPCGSSSAEVCPEPRADEQRTATQPRFLSAMTRPRGPRPSALVFYMARILGGRRTW